MQSSVLRQVFWHHPVCSHDKKGLPESAKWCRSISVQNPQCEWDAERIDTCLGVEDDAGHNDDNDALEGVGDGVSDGRDLGEGHEGDLIVLQVANVS
jgi:hypothetical protein